MADWKNATKTPSEAAVNREKPLTEWCDRKMFSKVPSRCFGGGGHFGDPKTPKRWNKPLGRVLLLKFALNTP
jgi:hypothetical protein